MFVYYLFIYLYLCAILSDFTTEKLRYTKFYPPFHFSHYFVEFVWPMQILTLLLKFCSAILQFLGIFDIARLYVIRWAFIFPRLTKFQEKKILSGCFKLVDLNLGLAEAIEILKTTAQKFGKSGRLLFETLKIVVSSEGKEGTNYQLWMIIIQIRTSKR